MNKITYEVVEHDGGWAYRVDGVFSETFPSHHGPQSGGARSEGTSRPGRYDGHLLRGQGGSLARRSVGRR
jgi:hypothetical protein